MLFGYCLQMLKGVWDAKCTRPIELESWLSQPIKERERIRWEIPLSAIPAHFQSLKASLNVSGWLLDLFTVVYRQSSSTRSGVLFPTPLVIVIAARLFEEPYGFPNTPPRFIAVKPKVRSDYPVVVFQEINGQFVIQKYCRLSRNLRNNNTGFVD